MTTPAISVVIPVHNSGAFLKKCLDSALDQSFRDFEIVCINDCSTDDSVDIMASASHSDSRVRMVSFPENRGVCAARNAGIENARGEFVFFLDSDDWIDPDYLGGMLHHARTSGMDMIINSSFVMEFPNSTCKRYERPAFLREEPSLYPFHIIQGWLNPILCIRLFRKKFLDDNRIRFLPFGGAEDIYFNGLADAVQGCGYVFEGPDYHYRQGSGSLSHGRGFGFCCIESFRALYLELISRGLAVDRMRLFHARFGLEVDTEDKFLFIKEYFNEIAPLVNNYRDPYTGADMLFFEAVTSSRNYEEFRDRHSGKILPGYLRSRVMAARSSVEKKEL